jgi:hypothetical protein
MPKPPKLPKLEYKPEYAVSVWKDRTEVKVVLVPWPATQGETSEHFTLSIQYLNPKDEIMVTRTKANRQQLITFLEEWVPKCPDPELLNERLAKLSSEVPEGIL